MRRKIFGLLLVVFTVICLSCAAHAETASANEQLWKQYYRLYSETCFAQDEQVGVEMMRILEQILQNDPEDWLAKLYYEEPMTVLYVYAQDVTPYEAWRENQSHIELFEQAGIEEELSDTISAQTIAQSEDPVEIKVLKCRKLGSRILSALSSGAESALGNLPEAAEYYTTAIGLCDDLALVTEMRLDMLRLYFGFDPFPRNGYYLSPENEYSRYDADEIIEVCEAISNSADEMLSGIVYDETSEALLRLRIGEANAFLAYCRYYENDTQGMLHYMEKLDECVEWYKTNIPDIPDSAYPILKTYDAHTEMLYYDAVEDSQKVRNAIDQYNVGYAMLNSDSYDSVYYHQFAFADLYASAEKIIEKYQ